MPNWISNYVEPSNDAAKAFTKKYLLNDDGLFCFGKLVPVPDIIDKITGSPSFVVSPEKFQAFKAEHQESVHCEYEQEGLLYTLDEDGEVNDAVCTAECSDHLRNKFGCDNLYDFHVNNWGTKWEAQDNGNGTEYDDNGDPIDCEFDTAWDAPFEFMATLTAECPEGIWEWRCTAENSFESLLIRLHNGDVVITEHLLDEEELEELFDDEDCTIEDLYWNDRGEVVPYDAKDENDTKLVPSEVLSVQPNYKVRVAPQSRYWPNWVEHQVKPINDAAKAFTKKYVFDKWDDVCFGFLVSVPDILTKTFAVSYCLVSPEELQAFKDEYQQSVQCEYEQEGLLYTLDEDDEVERVVCTAECVARLKEMYDCDNGADFWLQNYGTEWDGTISCDYEGDEGDPEFYTFRTDFVVPWLFMTTIADKCPEGQWEWRCNAANGFESLLIKLHNGDVVITEHLLDEAELESRRKAGQKSETIDDIHWNDRGEVPRKGKNDTKLELGKVLSVKPNYVVPKRANLT